ncbi:MarR family winged helix-turn-helix transcriptional regulator [Sphingomonas bacterium]|uniref:MarR family winged helix-turn-helix transcriptional regulator n=1 Tax=Sphingomonas bacterium TaxID=1895847 RepID=UPI0015777570|nr:MarR family winged helix-turn-helix transcriptional regulator [Sphingomonas bacterium]
MMILQASATIEREPGTSIMVIGAANGHAAGQQAIAAVNARLVERLDWQDVGPSLSQHTACSIIMVETEGTDDDILVGVLPRIDAFAAALDMPVVVALEHRSIDIVAATMLSARAQLLCSPTLSDRVVALAIATEQRGAMLVHDVVREGEAARLHRLNEEVARIADVLARLTRRSGDERPVTHIVSDHPTPFKQEHRADVVIDAAEVRRAIRARRLRDQHFGSGFFEDPAWDILLDLFAADLEGTQVSVSSLCIAASVAPTTALRWISKLTDSGLLERHPDPFDRRRAFMELSSGASRAMRDHVATLRRAGLPFG